MLSHIKSQQDWEEKGLGAKGFTLIELLVVIIILGILAAVVIFAVSGITNKGQISACKTEASTVRTAVEAYNAQNGSYPAAITNLYTGTGTFLQSAPTLVTVNLAASPPTYQWTTNSKCTTAGGMSSADATTLGNP